MANLSKEKREVLALLDAIIAMSEKNPSDISLSGTISLNPFDFLMEIITKKVSFDELLDWLVDILTKSLPYIELGVKGVLLANLKETVDCNNDPRIPNWMRKDLNAPYDGFISSHSELNRGLIFNLRNIDYRNILKVSPFVPQGMNYYFGTKSYCYIDVDDFREEKYSTFFEAVEVCKTNGISLKYIVTKSEVNNVYDLVRARDFNAFLWYVVHKGYSPNVLNAADCGVTEPLTKVIEKDVTTSNIDGKEIKYSYGDCIINATYPNILSMCLCNKGVNIESYPYIGQDIDNLSCDNSFDVITYSLAPKYYNFKFVPFSSDRYSVNWYVNSGTFFDFLKKEEEREPRNYEKEYPICNLQYVHKYQDEHGVQDENIVFTILPKPYVHLPEKGDPLWRIKPILFDADGNPSSKGKYSVKNRGDYNLNKETGEYELIGDTSKLYECYPKLTVYEFNYDFVMGMQLFDSTVIASQLIETITNIRCGFQGNVGLNVGVNKSETAYQMRIAEIVKNIVESTAYEVSDCFYSFDNAKYDSMLREAELKRSRLHVSNDDVNKVSENSSEDIMKILNEFDNNATLNENKEVIKRAITKATATITEEVLPEDKYNIEINIIQDLIKSFVTIIVEALITPKIVLLFEVNRALMGQNFTKFNIEDFLKSIEGLLVSIVREIRDLILQELINWCMKILRELLDIITDALLMEQIEYYSRLMKLLFKACSFKVSHRSPLDSKLDEVNYADIDEIDKPKEANC